MLYRSTVLLFPGIALVLLESQMLVRTGALLIYSGQVWTVCRYSCVIPCWSTGHRLFAALQRHVLVHLVIFSANKLPASNNCYILPLSLGYAQRTCRRVLHSSQKWDYSCRQCRESKYYGSSLVSSNTSYITVTSAAVSGYKCGSRYVQFMVCWKCVLWIYTRPGIFLRFTYSYSCIYSTLRLPQ